MREKKKKILTYEYMKIPLDTLSTLYSGVKIFPIQYQGLYTLLCEMMPNHKPHTVVERTKILVPVEMCFMVL